MENALNRPLHRWTALALSSALLFALHPAARADADTIRKVLEPKLRMKIDEARPLPLGGLWEVIAGKRVLYTDAQATFLLGGPLLEVATDRDLTRATMERLLRVDVARLPLDDAVAIVRGKGTRRLFVFEDPNCPYCKKLDAELEGLDDVTIYAFLYPILAEDSMDKSRSIWCAPDRVAARAATFANRPVEKAAECETPMQRNLALGERLHIDGTPTLVFADGSRFSGAVAREKLAAMLAEHSPAQIEAKE